MTLLPDTPTLEVAVVAAPYDGGSHAAELRRRGMACVAVMPAPVTVPGAYTCTPIRRDDYVEVLRQQPGVWNLAAIAHRLEARYDVQVVIPGSARGVDMADRLAAVLKVAGNPSPTSAVRRDRGLQAQALTTRRIPAPASLRTTSRTEAVAWAHQQWAAAATAGLRPRPCVVLAADSSVRAPSRLCRSTHDITTAWSEQARAAEHQAGDDHLVIQDYLPGPRYTLHSLTSSDRTGTPVHTITQVWAQSRTSQGRHDRSHLVPPMGSWVLRHRRLTLYTARVLDALGIRSGPAHCLIAYTPDHGPVLLSARAYAERSPATAAVSTLTGSDPVADTVRAALPAPAARPGDSMPAPLPLHIMRVPLHLPADGGRVDGTLWARLSALRSLHQVVGPLTAGSTIPPSLGQVTQRTELVLSGPTYQAVEHDHSLVRTLEGNGLYGHPPTDFGGLIRPLPLRSCAVSAPVSARTGTRTAHTASVAPRGCRA